MAEKMLPTFFVVGAAKCGTTSLHHYLSQHPEIEMSSVKEPQVFADGDYRARLAEYRDLFAGRTAVRGESSAVYSQFPRWAGIPERIATEVPGARIVYLVRDPIARAIAHYVQHVADGKESRPLAEALADWESPDSLFLCPSRYATQLQRYLEHFPAERILVVDQHDLLERRPATVAHVFEFLEVDPSRGALDLEERLNIREFQRSATTLGRRARSTRLFQTARRLPIRGAARRGVRRVFSRPVGRPELEPDLRERIAGSLASEIEWLRRFTGQRFPTWSV